MLAAESFVFDAAVAAYILFNVKSVAPWPGYAN